MANPAGTNNHVKGQKMHEKGWGNAAERVLIHQINCQLIEIHVMHVNYILICVFGISSMLKNKSSSKVNALFNVTALNVGLGTIQHEYKDFWQSIALKNWITPYNFTDKLQHPKPHDTQIK